MVLWTSLTVIPASLAIGVFAGRSRASGWGPSIFAIALMIVILVPTLYRNYRKQVARWQTFRIAISHDTVTRSQEGHKEVTVSASSISRIVKVPGRGLLIYAGRSQPEISIPDTLDGFESCCALMQQFRPIEARPRGLFRPAFTIPIALLFVAVYSAFLRSTDLPLVALLGVLILAVTALGFWRIRSSPEIDERTKRIAWLFLFLMLQVGVRVWSVWNVNHQVEHSIRHDHLLSLLVKARPDLRERLMKALVAATWNKAESRNGSYVSPAAAILGDVLPQYLPLCPDDAIRRYATETVNLLEKLEADPSEICYDWLKPRGLVVPMRRVVGEHGLDALYEAMAGVVESALESPQAAPNRSDAEALNRRIMDRLRNDASLGPLEFRSPEVPGFDKKRYCRTVEIVFRSFLDMPEKESSLVLRYALSTPVTK